MKRVKKEVKLRDLVNKLLESHERWVVNGKKNKEEFMDMCGYVCKILSQYGEERGE